MREGKEGAAAQSKALGRRERRETVEQYKYVYSVHNFVRELDKCTN